MEKKCIVLTPKDKKVLRHALNLLVDHEEDSIDHTKLYSKLRVK